MGGVGGLGFYNGSVYKTTHETVTVQGRIPFKMQILILLLVISNFMGIYFDLILNLFISQKNITEWLDNS